LAFIIIYHDTWLSECQIPTLYSEVPTFNSQLQDSYSDTLFMVYFRLLRYRKWKQLS